MSTEIAIVPVTAHSPPKPLLESTMGDLRSLLNCNICVRPMYEPYTIQCGHSFCYSCLVAWFEKNPRKETCPECRARVHAKPAPSFALREMSRIFVNRIEFLEDGETTAEHSEAQREESSLVEKHRADKAGGGLFPGFRERFGFRPGMVINDEEDRVARCPDCTWELENGYCFGCDMDWWNDSADDAELSDSDINSIVEDMVEEELQHNLDHIHNHYGIHQRPHHHHTPPYQLYDDDSLDSDSDEGDDFPDSDVAGSSLDDFVEHDTDGGSVDGTRSDRSSDPSLYIRDDYDRNHPYFPDENGDENLAALDNPGTLIEDNHDEENDYSSAADQSIHWDDEDSPRLHSTARSTGQFVTITSSSEDEDEDEDSNDGSESSDSSSSEEGADEPEEIDTEAVGGSHEGNTEHEEASSLTLVEDAGEDHDSDDAPPVSLTIPREGDNRRKRRRHVVDDSDDEDEFTSRPRSRVRLSSEGAGDASEGGESATLGRTSPSPPPRPQHIFNQRNHRHFCTHHESRPPLHHGHRRQNTTSMAQVMRPGRARGSIVELIPFAGSVSQDEDLALRRAEERSAALAAIEESIFQDYSL